MENQALDGVRVVDCGGTVATGYCGKLFADHGAHVVDLESDAGFDTRRLAPFMGNGPARVSALHAYLSTNKHSVLRTGLSETQLRRLLASADLVLDDGFPPEPVATAAPAATRMSIGWYGAQGPYAGYRGTDAQMFALNGMLRGIGPEQGPPLIPTGYQAQIVGGMTAFIGCVGHIIGADAGHRGPGHHLHTSLFEAALCFTDVGVVAAYNTGLDAPRMGINRFPPTYPLGVFPCRDGWLGVTVLTPGQWHAFCALLDMNDLADVPLFQSAVGRLQALDLIEPVFTARLLDHSAEDLFYRGQEAGIPLARVPTLEELFSVDQFVQRQAFANAGLPDGRTVTVPASPFRLCATPAAAGGKVPALGAHTGAFAT